MLTVHIFEHFFLLSLYRHMTGLIENGNVYIAQPPLYKLKSGKEEKYAFNDQEKDCNS